jgi:hypothetical protein
VPAPAVIPAPIAYIKFVAVKKLVVGLKNFFLLVRRKTVCTGEKIFILLDAIFFSLLRRKFAPNFLP